MIASEFTCGACGSYIVDYTATAMIIRGHPEVCPGRAPNVCECGHTHIAGDEGADEGCSICKCQHWAKLCGRCHYEGLGGCGDGRGFPDCMEPRTACATRRSPQATPTKLAFRGSQ